MDFFIDTHSHIYDEAFRDDFEAVTQRCLQAGVTTLIMPGISSATHKSMLEAAEKLKGMAYPCIGLHPTEVGANWEEELSFVKENLPLAPFKAIGEIGLDRHWDDTYLPQQMRVLEEQIEIAHRNSLPVLLHVRDATEEMFKALDDTRGLHVKGIFHAFSGSYETYRRCLTYGDFKFGIGGVVTYKNAGIASVIPRMAPADIVLETDCPWLTPAPYRGQRNESSYIPIIASQVASLTGMSIGKVAELTSGTAKKLFNL